MAKVKSYLVSSIIKEHFGELVEKVTSYLLENGHQTLKSISKNVNLTSEEIKQSLSILIHHNLVSYKKNEIGITEYHIELDLILKRKRYQKYVYCAKLKFGDIAELIIEALLLNGCDILSHVAKRVTDRLEVDDNDEEERPDELIVIQNCRDLVKGHFIKRVSNPYKEEDTEIDDKELYAIPSGIGKKRKAIVRNDETVAKKSKNDSAQSNEEVYEDCDVYWHVNFERFDQLIMDQMIIDATSERIDQNASKIVAAILKLSELERTLSSTATNSFSIYDISKKMTNFPKLEHQETHQYLTLLSDEKTGGFVSKTDDSAGGMYCVNLQKSLEMICQSACSTIVQERFGSKACRVFRLLLQKNHLEQKQIGELAMIPFKEVKELLYKLFEERFLKIQEVSKASDYAPSRTFYLFRVDMPHVARLLLSRCYQAIGNLMLRREAEMEENKRLLEKNEKIDGILSALSKTNEDTEQVMAELEELITPTEKQQLEKLKVDLARLEQGEIQVEDTIFILQNYIRFH